VTPDQHRRRYIALIKEGKEQKEAARIANEEMRASALSTAEKLKAHSQQQQSSEKQDNRETVAQPMEHYETVPLGGGAIPVPKDWRELPWPELRALAERVAGRKVTSRSDASAVIVGVQ